MVDIANQSFLEMSNSTDSTTPREPLASQPMESQMCVMKNNEAVQPYSEESLDSPPEEKLTKSRKLAISTILILSNSILVSKLEIET
jgi:hypothetical protein